MHVWSSLSGELFLFLHCLKCGRACGGNSVPLAPTTPECRPCQARWTPRWRHFLRIHFHLPPAIRPRCRCPTQTRRDTSVHIRKRDVVVNGANFGAVLLAMSHFATFKTLARKDAFAFAALAEPTDFLGRVLASFPRTLAPIAQPDAVPALRPTRSCSTTSISKSSSDNSV